MTIKQNITVSMPDELLEEMKEFEEVNWSVVCRNAIRAYIESRRGSEPSGYLHQQ